MDTKIINDRGKKILDLVQEFCAKELDEEYFELAEKLTQKLLRKRSKPLDSGQPQIWAASIIHTLGTINFLFDKSFEPYISLDDLNNHFGTSKTTTAAKSKQIRDLLKIDKWDNEFSTKRMVDGNPFNKLVMVDDLIVPLDSLPEELQNAVRQARAEGKDISFRTR
jgi:hypothetical protein